MSYTGYVTYDLGKFLCAASERMGSVLDLEEYLSPPWVDFSCIITRKPQNEVYSGTVCLFSLFEIAVLLVKKPCLLSLHAAAETEPRIFRFSSPLPLSVPSPTLPLLLLLLKGLGAAS